MRMRVKNDHGPIPEEFREKMNRLAAFLDDAFNPQGEPKQIGFALIMTHFGNQPGGQD